MLSDYGFLQLADFPHGSLDSFVLAGPFPYLFLKFGGDVYPGRNSLNLVLQIQAFMLLAPGAPAVLKACMRPFPSTKHPFSW